MDCTELLADNGIDKRIQAIFTHYCNGLTHAEIGKKLDISRVAVTKRLKRFRQRYPAITPSFEATGRMTRYSESMDGDVVCKF